MIRKALITGITGQDGAYLAELLREQKRRGDKGRCAQDDRLADRLGGHQIVSRDQLSAFT
jgi:GDP-D-mannose dehydratase